MQFGDVDEALRGSRPGLRRRVLLRRQHAPARSSSTRPSRTWTAMASWWCIRARRRRTTCIARSPRHWRVPAAHIRVIAAPNGGGFGGKSDPFNHEIAVAKAALILDRPVKITLTREEVFYCHRGRHPVMMKFRTGVKKDGTLTAVHLQTILDGGCLRLVRRRQHLLYRRAADGDLPRAALQVRGLPRFHEQGAVRPQARARHAAEPVRPGSPDRQDCRAHGHRSRRRSGCASSSSRTR